MRKTQDADTDVKRARVPDDNELIGIVQQRLGNKKMQIMCSDGKLRLTRVPGSKRRLWVREGDFVVVQPWSIQSDTRGDVVHRYTGAEVEWLKKNGHLDEFQ
ncbi:MAG: translation initiation factor eIF-1A [Candidatus Undinarchaeales archaeon]|nr:translation initiation factor eIF-1A [Candidatus Undinarchaeales archaeon]MDP7493558.1 translation initiation factor eIF-1A [Candidatus Undinarchaeales archaeon]